MPNPKTNKYLRFSSVFFQMAAIIGGAAYLGIYLDGQSGKKQSTYTLVCSLTGVALAMYVVIKEVIQISKEDE